MNNATESAQPMRERNIESIVSYFESGVKESAQNIGIELEHTIVHADGMAPVPYSGEHGVAWILTQLQEDYPDAAYDGDDLVGVSRPKEAVTIEPAAQLELSAGPFSDLGEAAEVLDGFEKKLESVLAPVGLQATTFGYHPTAKAADLELIPKKRYEFMNSYLGAIGPFGPCMMRGSAATQVSIDYHSVEDCLRKMRLASILVPLLSLITDNAPVFEGELRKHRMVRTEIWNECDPDRCRLVPHVLEDGFDLRAYAEYVLDTPAILVPDDEERWKATDLTFGEFYAQRPMERADVEHALSMFFNDVRLKTYVEIRPADAMPADCVVAYAALIKGIFYNEGMLERYLEKFADVTEADVVAAKQALMEDGYEATVYGDAAWDLLDKLMFNAKLGLPKEDREYLEPLASLVFNRLTLADCTVVE